MNQEMQAFRDEEEYFRKLLFLYLQGLMGLDILLKKSGSDDTVHMFALNFLSYVKVQGQHVLWKKAGDRSSIGGQNSWYGVVGKYNFVLLL